MPKAGIVCDNWKLDKFKSELISKGFNNFEVIPFIKETSTIKVHYFNESQKNEIHKLCIEVEEHFRKLKAKNN